MRDEKTAKKLSNKGFSLVELIIVIAIMAILVGVVGTQVVPYIEKSREAKDYQVVSSIATAANTAFSQNVTLLDSTKTNYQITLKNGTGGLANDIVSSGTDAVDAKIMKDLAGLLVGTDNASTINFYKQYVEKMESKAGKNISDIVIDYNASTGQIMVKVNQKDSKFDSTFTPVSSKGTTAA